jgi:hypothetical protein
MTITSQSLRGDAKSDYKKILDRYRSLSRSKQDRLREVQAKITADAIKSEATAREKIKKKMADLIKLRILNSSEFNE